MWKSLIGDSSERPSVGVEEIHEKCGQKGPKTQIGVVFAGCPPLSPIVTKCRRRKKEVSKLQNSLSILHPSTISKSTHTTEDDEYILFNIDTIQYEYECVYLDNHDT